MIALKPLASITFVSFAVAVSLGCLVACGSADDPDPEPTGSAGAALTADGGTNPADKAALGDPSLTGASPVQPSPWDHLILNSAQR